MEQKFKPLQQVLMRGNETEEWVCGVYSHYDDVLNSHCVISHCIMGDYYEHCIPYDGNEALLGTTDEPKPKRWRAEKGERYWHINYECKCFESVDDHHHYDDSCYEVGNYFRTEQEAEAKAQLIKQILIKDE